MGAGRGKRLVFFLPVVRCGFACARSDANRVRRTCSYSMYYYYGVLDWTFSLFLFLFFFLFCGDWDWLGG